MENIKQQQTELGEVNIGWDIGIKNMSYCQIQPVVPSILGTQVNASKRTPEKNLIKLGQDLYYIAGWDIINVVPKVNQFINENGEITLESRSKVTCAGVVTTGSGQKNACGKPAAHCCVQLTPGTQPLQPQLKGYCNTHYKKAGLQPNDTVEILPTACRCWWHAPESGERCQTAASSVTAANPYIGYCKKHLPVSSSAAGAIPATPMLKIIRNKKVASLDLTMLAAALFDELDARQQALVTAEDVLLENQPVLKNPTMKTMQTFLYSWYVIHGVQKPPHATKNIHCYCASNKLDIIKLLPTNIATEILRKTKEIKSQYSRNKKLAVFICQYLLENGIGCTELLQKFTDKKKQDDLADSMLMTLHWLKRAELAKLRAAASSTAAKKKKGKTSLASETPLDELQTEYAALINEILPKRGGGKSKTVEPVSAILGPASITSPSKNKLRLNLDSPPLSDSSVE